MTEYDGVERSTASETLCAMLDERGVEHEGGERSVRWRDHNGVMMQAFPLANGELGMEVWSCTPEQAIAATLGAGTCRMEQTCHVQIAGFDVYHDDYVCSECGGEMLDGFKFCPTCGRRVVDA